MYYGILCDIMVEYALQLHGLRKHGRATVRARSPSALLL